MLSSKVIKVLWGSDWDELFAQDHHGAVLRRLQEIVDGDLHRRFTPRITPGSIEIAFLANTELERLVRHLPDAKVDRLRRGGHDPLKIFAAFDAARRQTGSPP